MNHLIQEIAKKGTELDIYNAICSVGTYVAVIYSIYHGFRLKVPKLRMLIVLACVAIAMGSIQGTIYDLLWQLKEIQFLGMETTVNSIVRVFIFLPLIAYILAKILRLKWALVCDAIAMYPLVKSGIAQLACIFPGCCRGYLCQWGIYNMKVDALCFPIQILETILTLGIFAFLVIRTKRKNYVSDGTLFPLMMTLYGIMRFICEALRDNEKLFLGISPVGYHALLLFVVGWIALRRIKKKQQTLPCGIKGEEISSSGGQCDAQ